MDLHWPGDGRARGIADRATLADVNGAVGTAAGNLPARDVGHAAATREPHAWLSASGDRTGIDHCTGRTGDIDAEVAAADQAARPVGDRAARGQEHASRWSDDGAVVIHRPRRGTGPVQRTAACRGHVDVSRSADGRGILSCGVAEGDAGRVAARDGGAGHIRSSPVLFKCSDRSELLQSCIRQKYAQVDQGAIRPFLSASSPRHRFSAASLPRLVEMRVPAAKQARKT